MDHPFTPPARIPACLPKPKTPKTENKGKAEYFGTLPANSDAHLTEEELQQLTRSSMEATRPIFSRSHSRESRSSRSSVNYDRRYGRSGSVSSIPVTVAPRKPASAAGLTVLDLMQAQYNSSNNVPSSYSQTQDIPHLTGLDIQEATGSSNGTFSSATSDNRARDLKYSHDGPSTPAPTSIRAGSGKHLTGADLHLPKDEVPDSVNHLIEANLRLPDESGPFIQSPFPVARHHIDELEKSASVAALLLEKMDFKPSTPTHRLPENDCSAPAPPSLPIRKNSAKSVSAESFESLIITPTVMTAAVYEMLPPPSVVALISNLGSQGDSSSDPNWPLPAKTPVYTFVPPPPSQSPIASSLEASIPSNIPSPIGSPVTATQQPQTNSFIPPPHTVPIGAPATPMLELPDSFSILTPQGVSRIASPAPAKQEAAVVGTMIPPPYVVATSAAPYNQPFSATPTSMAPSATSSGQTQQRIYLNPTPIAPYTQPVSVGPHDMTVHSSESDAVAAARAVVGAMIPPPYDLAKMAAPYHQPFSDTPNSAASSQDYQSALSREVSTQGRHQPYTSMPHPGTQHDPNFDALAAARAAYSHANNSASTNTQQPSQPPAYIPPTMASRYRNSVDYNQPNNSQPNTAVSSNWESFKGTTNASPSTPFTQPAAYMPPSMASHYRESTAVAEAKEAYDRPNNVQLYAAAVSERDSHLGTGLNSLAGVPYSQPSAYMPPGMATHYRESSTVVKAKETHDKAANPAAITMQRSNSGRAVPGALYGAIAGFNQAFNGQQRPQTPIELSAVNNATLQKVQSTIFRVPVPVHGSTPATQSTLNKPPPVVVLPDAGLAPQPPFRNNSKLNHEPNLHPNPIMHGQPPNTYNLQPNTYTRNPIDRQLPANAPSLHIETVPSFPRPVAKEASFWRRRQKALIILLVIVLIGIGVGIVFVAHSFYTRWGGVGFLKKREVEEFGNREGYVQAANGEVWGQRKGREARDDLEGKKGRQGSGKGLLENMLVGGYKRGWGTDYKDGKHTISPLPKAASDSQEEAYQPPPKEPKKFSHIVQVIPVGSTPHLQSTGSSYDIGSNWWNDRVNEMHKRGEELISSHPQPEDALKHAAVLAQRFVEEIRSRIEASGPGNGPSCPPACRSESDVEVAKVLASDYVDRVPVDVANEYDVEMLMSSMDTGGMERPAQEVAMLAAKGYVARVPEDVRGMMEGERKGKVQLDKRGVLTEENIERLIRGKDVPELEAESVTVTVTETRVHNGAPTGLSPQDQAKQFASGYVDSAPHEVEVELAESSTEKRNAKTELYEVGGVKLAGSFAAKRWAARKASADIIPWSSLGANSPQEDATQKAGEYARHVPDGQPLSECEKAKVNAGFYARQFREDHVMSAKRLERRDVIEPAELIASAFLGRLKLKEEGRKEPVQDVAKRNAGHYARQAPKGPVERLASLFGAGLKSEEDAGRWSDGGKSGKRDNNPSTCGDARNGCEAYGHPEICCPPSYTCHKSPTTNSGIICCEGTEDCFAPDGEVPIQTSCPRSTVACPVEAGGGCCPSLDQCAPNGCLEFEEGYSPSDAPAIAVTETRSITITATESLMPGVSEVVTKQAATITRTVTQLVGGDVRVKATMVKDGEVVMGPEETFGSGAVVKAQGFKPKSQGVRVGRREGMRWLVWELGFVAVFMGML